ncbi:ABC transporter permease [Georgenia thermotolerans]|uniref:ABC transporter permease n=1 Tax=Georgenia thermotolerans TaxID=527326 RepID=A0A7J5UMF9_9MICO|nr:ABC transporter permease [Georgenia thermotolerans]KAE8763470.1 ABC transporter permease [Georgenia thermotolerans]
MTTQTLPAAGADAGTRARRVLAQTRFETAAVLRNGEQLLLTFILPVIALVVLVRTDLVALPGATRTPAALAGVLALAVASTAFTSQAIAVAFDRRWGVLRMLATTPLGRRGLLAGKLGAVVCVLAVQAVVLMLVAAGLGWRGEGLGVVALLGGALFVLLGAAAFVSLALLIGGTLRPEAVLAVANLLWVLMAGAGGLLLPADTLPGPLAQVVVLLPSGALGEGLRLLATTGRLDLAALAVLAVWTAAGSWLAARYFRWD